MPPPDVTFARESFHDMWEEAAPLLFAHWREIAHYQDIELDPDLQFYARCQDSNLLRVYTARLVPDGVEPSIAGKLIGYGVYFVKRAPHYQTSLTASQDVLFIEKDYRKSMVGASFLKFTHDQLRAEGVQVVYQHMKIAHDRTALMRHLGYEPVDTIFAKRLDR